LIPDFGVLSALFAKREQGFTEEVLPKQKNIFQYIKRIRYDSMMFKPAYAPAYTTEYPCFLDALKRYAGVYADTAASAYAGMYPPANTLLKEGAFIFSTG
jgi:hypothetical protein